MAHPGARTKSDDDLGEMWDLIRQHHGDLAGVKSEVSGVKKDVGALGETVGRYGAKLDEVLNAVTSHTARQGPGLMQIMSGLGLLLAIVGGLSTGIAVFVGNMYGGQLAGLERDLSAAKFVIASREGEDRTELSRLREVERAAVADRLRRIEENQAWTPKEITKIR